MQMVDRSDDGRRRLPLPCVETDAADRLPMPRQGQLQFQVLVLQDLP